MGKGDIVYVRTADGDVHSFKNAKIRMSTHGVLCVISSRDCTNVIHAYPEGAWKEASNEVMY